jgi:hypothetical protein
MQEAKRSMRAGAVVGVLGVLAGVCGPVVQAASSPVTIEAVVVEPQSPAAGVLCRLSVRVKNAGTRAATSFRFKVSIDGREEATYANEVYAVNVDPATSGTIGLYNFWSPSPAKASFTVEVTLVEAQWAEVKREGKTTTTTPLGPVEGLPTTAVRSVSPATGK